MGQRADRLPPLHAVTDDAIVARAGFLTAARAIIEAAGPRLALHLRAPSASGRRVFGLAAELGPLTRRAGALLVVNDRVDVALAAGADGVQLGARGMRPADARAVTGSQLLVGASVHSAAEATAMLGEGADFLILGTIWATPSHPGRPGVGTARLREVVALGAATVAIGGVTPERAPRVRAAGADGVAVLRGVWDAPDPAAAVREYLRAWEGSMEESEQIRVRVNGEERDVPGGMDLVGLLEHFELHPRMVVVEHNGEILRRDALEGKPVREGDRLELVHFVGGG